MEGLVLGFENCRPSRLWHPSGRLSFILIFFPCNVTEGDIHVTYIV